MSLPSSPDGRADYSFDVHKSTTVGREVEIEAISERIRSQQSVLLAGPAGVGKSHLAAAIADAFAADGWQVVRLSGGPAMRTVHLGAAQPLLSPSAARTPDELFANVERGLRRGTSSPSTLLVVDDINQIDPASAALFRQLCASGIDVLATVRDDGAADPFVLALWTEGLLERIDIEPFALDASNRLVSEVLGGAVQESVQNAVHALAQGNPLLIRELLADARNAKVLVRAADTWELTGEMRAERRVSDLFVTRLATLDDSHRHALEQIALAESLAIGIAQQVSNQQILERLETTNFIAVAGDQVRCNHPMLAEVIRREIPSLRAERLIGSLIDVIVSSADSEDTDILRAVRWQIERGEAPSPATAVVAAHTALAIFDGATAVLCAQAAFDPASVASHVLLGRAQFIAQDHAAAITTLQRGRELASTDAERAMNAVCLGEVLAFGTGDFAQASSVLNDALATITEPQHRAMVAGSLSLAQGLVGDFGPALMYGDELLDIGDLDAAARLNLSLMWTIGAVWTGRLVDTQQRIDTARELAIELRSEMPAALDQILITQLMFDTQEGRYSQALALATEQRRAAEREHRFTALWDHGLGFIAILAGQGAAALAHSRRAVGELAYGDPIGVAPLIHAGDAMVFAMAGDLAAASAAHDVSIGDPRSGPREQPFLARARANVLALQGDIADAVNALVEGAANAGQSPVQSAWALYDGVRFDRAAAVADRLRMLAEQAPVESLLAMNDHCAALVAGDANNLAKAAERLSRGGFVLYAAEAAAHASRQLDIDGDQSGAARMALRASVFFDRCDGVRSLAVEAMQRPLTDREYEVARSAAQGAASQDIADLLFVSRRTVDNHLQNTYRKLGINQRDDLARIFNVEVN